MSLPNKSFLGSSVFQSVVENANFAVLLFDNQTLVYANSRSDELLGLSRNSSLDAADILPSEVFQSLCLQSERVGNDQLVKELELRFASDESNWIELTVSNLLVDGRLLQQLIFRDITKSKQREASLLKEAHTDDLSGLGNRRQFRRTLDSCITESVCLAIVDVDHFKSINDSFGHIIGDNAIRFVASRLLEHFGNELCVARLGGEEFGIVVAAPVPEEMEQRFEEFRLAIESGTATTQTIKLTVSIGVAFSNPTEAVRELLDRADKALYKSKNAGRNRLTILR